MSASALHRLVRTLFLILSLVAPSFGSSLPKPVLTTTFRTQMVVDLPGGGHEGAICSATAVGPHALLTATHCDLGSSLVTIDDGFPIPILDRISDGNDHTIFILAATFEKTASFAPHSPKVGDEVWLRGNPAGLHQLVRRGILSGYIVEDGEVIQMFDINGWHGDSGGAIFNSHGEIAAVVTYGFSVGGFNMIGCLELRFTPAQLLAASK